MQVHSYAHMYAFVAFNMGLEACFLVCQTSSVFQRKVTIRERTYVHVDEHLVALAGLPVSSFFNGEADNSQHFYEREEK